MIAPAGSRAGVVGRAGPTDDRINNCVRVPTWNGRIDAIDRQTIDRSANASVRSHVDPSVRRRWRAGSNEPERVFHAGSLVRTLVGSMVRTRYYRIIDDQISMLNYCTFTHPINVRSRSAAHSFTQ